jgi:hypothetical protein
MKDSPFETVLRSERGDVAIRFRFKVIGGRRECVGVEVTREKHPITTSFMRKFRWSDLIKDKQQRDLRKAQKELRGPGRLGGALDPETMTYWSDDEIRAEAELVLETPAGGRPQTYGPDHWAEVARVYSDAWGAGLNPTKAVAHRWHLARSTAATWVARARNEYGLLPKTSRRVAKGTGSSPRRRKKR